MTTQSGFGIRRRGRYCRRSRATGTRSALSYSLRTANCWRLHQVTTLSGYGTRRRERHCRRSSPRGWVNAVVFSQDGKLLVSASGDHTVRLWDLATGATLQMLKGHRNRVSAVMFSQDGKLLASASDDHTVRLWDPATGGAAGSRATGARSGPSQSLRTAN
jgi:WD40 repeat protein